MVSNRVRPLIESFDWYTHGIHPQVFHPKQKAWHAYLATSKSLQTINEISRVLFALLYVATRVLYFPYVMFTGVLPDCLSAANDHPEFVSPLYTVMLLGILFTMLAVMVTLKW